jgi:hypothetical protein
MRPLLRALAGLGLFAALALPALAAPAPVDSLPPGNLLELFLMFLRSATTGSARVEPGLRPALDLRLRQEVLDDLYYFDPVQQDRDHHARDAHQLR